MPAQFVRTMSHSVGDELFPEDYPKTTTRVTTPTAAIPPIKDEPPAKRALPVDRAIQPATGHWPRTQAQTQTQSQSSHHQHQLQALLDHDVIEAFYAIRQQRQPRYVAIRPELHMG